MVIDGSRCETRHRCESLRLTVVGITIEATVFFAKDLAIRRNVLGRRGFIDRLRLGVVDYDGLLLAGAYDDPAE